MMPRKDMTPEEERAERRKLKEIRGRKIYVWFLCAHGISRSQNNVYAMSDVLGEERLDSSVDVRNTSYLAFTQREGDKISPDEFEQKDVIVVEEGYMKNILVNAGHNGVRILVWEDLIRDYNKGRLDYREKSKLVCREILREMGYRLRD